MLGGWSCCGLISCCSLRWSLEFKWGQSASSLVLKCTRVFSGACWVLIDIIYSSVALTSLKRESCTYSSSRITAGWSVSLGQLCCLVWGRLVRLIWVWLIWFRQSGIWSSVLSVCHKTKPLLTQQHHSQLLFLSGLKLKAEQSRVIAQMLLYLCSGDLIDLIWIIFFFNQMFLMLSWNIYLMKVDDRHRVYSSVSVIYII